MDAALTDTVATPDDRIRAAPRAGRATVADAEWSTPVAALIGLGAALLAIGVRLAIPLPPDLLPTSTVVIALCIVTVFVGAVAGLATMVIGGLLAWYLFFTPESWAMTPRESVSMIGYLIVSTAILVTSQLYRASERRRRAAEVERAERDAERAELFAGEMAHRLKNALAIVQSIAGQTFQHDSPEVTKFSGRLQALSGAHNLLSEHVKEPTASLRQVIEETLRPFDDWRHRIRIDGPDVELRDRQVVSIALALHELATNAVKYGALSNAKGRVDVSWSGTGRTFELVWKEIDGPPVIPPQRSGFGTRLLNRAAMGTDLSYEPDGLRCVIRGG